MDKDLQAIQGVRDLVEKARKAQSILEAYSQEEVDRLVASMAEQGYRDSHRLAQLACEETGFGKVESKTEKNIFATRAVYQSIRNLKTVGIVSEDREKGLYEVATPMGIVAAIIPVTNPTSTALFKMLISIKARCPIILSPHPKAAKCTRESAETMKKAADSIGAPEGIIGCIPLSTMEATQELISHPDVAVILATGGAGLVKAAYSSGKPAIGVGPGNAPAFVERTANIVHSVRCLVASKSFDWGTICASEQSVILDQPIEQECLDEFRRQKAYICNEEEVKSLERSMPRGNMMNPDFVGRSPEVIARMAGFKVPSDTTVLLARQHGVGDRYPLSREKLCPILALYTENGWESACERCFELLRYGGAGHTLAIHSLDQKVITAFALAKPASRILVNAPSSQGAVGYATRLVPSMTLGCGSLGKNITSDNITCTHLLNIKRISFGKTGWFNDIASPRVHFSGPTSHPFVSPRYPFDHLFEREGRYFIGPHNNPNI